MEEFKIAFCTGDHLYKTNSELPLEKQMISALPDVRHVTLEPGDEFLVIACDGIWYVDCVICILRLISTGINI